MISSYLKKLFLVGVLVMIFFGPTKIFARDEMAIKISPIIFRCTLEKGQKKTDSISVSNPNNFSIQVMSEVEDFIMENEEGVPKFLPRSASTGGLSSWISVSLEEFALAANETKDVTFTISVPKTGEPGGHYAAIFFKTRPPQDRSGTSLGISSRVGSLILLSVPGEISSGGKIVEFSGPKFVSRGPVNFLARFQNTGTVHYQLGGQISIYNWLGGEVGKIDLPEHIVLPDSIRRFETKWEKKYLFGQYTAKLTMKDGEGKTQTEELKFFAFPWQEGLVVLGIIFLILAISIIFKKKFKIVRK